MRKVLFILFFTFLLTPTFFAYAEAPIKILLVPGHDDEVWGAQYGNIKEADMNLSLAQELFNILKKDKRFEVYITRKWGGYTKEFEDYFTTQEDEILAFKENAKADMLGKIISGIFIKKPNPPHNVVSKGGAVLLYGFNKWANENKIDAMIHIHFNDYPRPNKWTIGKYWGFNLYIPEEQMVNAKESKELAQNVFAKLKEKYVVSNYEKERAGLVPDQTLIALGSNSSLRETVRSILIEYGYIYEKKFRTKSTRHQAYKDMAKLTAQGIKSYFSPTLSTLP